MANIRLPTIEENGFISRPKSRIGSGRSSRNKMYRKKKSDKTDIGCELCIALRVTQVTQNENSITNREKSKELVDRFYSTVLENSEPFSQSLEAAIGLREITVKHISRGSLRIHLACTTLGSLESLNQMFRSRRLVALCNSVFLTPDVLEQVGVKSLKCEVDIDLDEIENCRELLVSRKFKENTQSHPADTLAAPMEHLTLDHIPITTDVTVISKEFDIDLWRRQINAEVEALKTRYQHFHESQDEYLRTLQIIMPNGKKEIKRLAEVMDLYSYLLASSGVSSGVRTDLVREFLQIVNNIRIVVDDIHTHYKSNITGGSSEDEDFCIMECLVSDMKNMLQPSNEFEEDISVLDRKVNSAEKPFTGLLCFIPLLLAKLTTVLYAISATSVG